LGGHLPAVPGCVTHRKAQDHGRAAGTCQPACGESVTAVSQRLLAHHGGLRGLFRLEVAELARVRGLGDGKAVRVKAALELGRCLAALF
jgi:DNA repair protein RadC